MPDRIVVFIDAQSVYKDAREAFFHPKDHYSLGQIDPVKFARLISTRKPPGLPEGPRVLAGVRVYAGLPSAARDGRTYSAYRRQSQNWRAHKVEVLDRPIRYPQDWPRQPAQQKGVDVALAVDFVAMAIEGGFDIGVIASTDTDLRPALEYALARGRSAEVAAWHTPRYTKRLHVPGRPIWCHRLSKEDYRTVADPRNYNLRA